MSRRVLACGRLLLTVALLLVPSLRDGEMPPALAQEVTMAIVPNDDLYEQYQWNLNQIHAPEAWDQTTGSPSVTIAILDTGVSQTHPDLIRKLVPGHNFINESAAPDDDHGNGTHVAGIAAADTNNHAGIAGIAWQARIMPVKVLDSEARGDPPVAAQGVIWAVDHGANIINLGLSGPDSSDALSDAVDYAYNHGVVVIAPVANNGTAEVTYPAAYPHVIAVAATDRNDERLQTSDVGSYISVSAPGERIASTFRGPGAVDTYAVASSTAQAAAHVSGVAALLLSVNPALKPDDVRTILETSADDVGQPGRDLETGAGRINAARAVLFASPWNYLPSGAGSYTGLTAPSNSVYFPLIQKDVSGWFTSFTIQNTSSHAVSLTVELHGADGKIVYTFPATLAAYASTTYQPAQIAGLQSGFNGTAAVYADGPITGVVNQDHAGRDRMTYEGVNLGSASVWVPLLMRSLNGWDTGLRIQNVSGAAARARVTFFTVDSATPLYDTLVPLGPLGSTTLYQPTDDRIPNGWMGSAVIESLDGQLLAAVVNEVSLSGADMSYVASGKPDQAGFAPLVYQNGPSWNTDVQVQNATAAGTNVAISYRSATDAAASWLVQRPLDPRTSSTLSHVGDNGPPDGFVGSATFRAVGGGQLVGVANHIHVGGDIGMAYRLPTTGGDTVNIPLIYRNFDGWNSGIQVQNLSTRPAPITTTIYQQDGTVVATLQDQIDASGSRTIYLPNVSAVSPGFVGGAIISSTGGSPIAAVANHVK